ncbi:hypothetical protein ACFXK0_26265 [Nocardia sp. NPDC059177]|uniref:hypothetical protein n=1 Tax=Nocardia sp. NPDC059177 TaxID=3346759 RepID=UPI00368B0CE6
MDLINDPMIGTFPVKTTKRRGLEISFATIALLALVGCSASTPSPSTDSTTRVGTPTAAAAKCVTIAPAVPYSADERQVADIIRNVSLPADTCLFGIDVKDVADQSGMIGIRIDLTVQGSTDPADLRPSATDIAHALKRADIAERTAELSVTNWGFPKPPYMDFLNDEHFRDNPWDGTPSREEEMARWEVLSV